jgi:nitric oxide reductase subunit B
MTSTKRLWTILAAMLIASFAVLLWSGNQIYRKMPPMPERVVSSEGELVYTRTEIETGRQVWQSMGGMQLGSIWGHGAYVAPDWSADWLHREVMVLLDRWARDTHGAAAYEDLTRSSRRARGAAARRHAREHLRSGHRHDHAA